MNIEFRPYDPDRDREAAHRIWSEVGWLEPGHEQQTAAYIECGSAHVVAIDGQAECLVTTAPAELHHLSDDVRAAAVTGVTTSHVARKQGFAARLLAQSLAREAESGAQIAVLGMFEQGFYNRLGFGTGSYEHVYSFDPAHLRTRTSARVPRRLDATYGAAVHRARLRRLRTHGGLNVLPEAVTTSDTLGRNGFALGYTDGPDGDVSHLVWCRTKDAEHGPYDVTVIFATWEQFHELMALLHNLGDQIHLVSLVEPALIQFQDLLDQPFKHRRITRRSRFEAGCRTCAYWQARILDLEACLAHTHLDAEPVRFNLQLADPIEAFLEAKGWQGVGGDYVVSLGRECWAERGSEPGLPSMTASVGAFTRMWLGVRCASALAVTDNLDAQSDLLARLDRAFALPTPVLGWDI